MQAVAAEFAERNRGRTALAKEELETIQWSIHRAFLISLLNLCVPLCLCGELSRKTFTTEAQRTTEFKKDWPFATAVFPLIFTRGAVSHSGRARHQRSRRY